MSRFLANVGIHGISVGLGFFGIPVRRGAWRRTVTAAALAGLAAASVPAGDWP